MSGNGHGSVDRQRDPRFRTADQALIVDGLRVWDYDWLPGTVCFSASRIDSTYWDGWFTVLRDDGTTKIMNGERLCVSHWSDHTPVPPFVDDRGAELRAALDAGARVMLAADHDPRYQPPVLAWTPRVPTDPMPWQDTVSHRRYRSAQVTPYPCDYCDQPATLRATDSADVLCDTDARDQYEQGRSPRRDATRPLTARDVTERLSG